MDIWNLGEQRAFSLLCSLSRILAPYFLYYFLGSFGH